MARPRPYPRDNLAAWPTIAASSTTTNAAIPTPSMAGTAIARSLTVVHTLPCIVLCLPAQRSGVGVVAIGRARQRPFAEEEEATKEGAVVGDDPVAQLGGPDEG